MNRAQLKELVKNIMSEESEYQAFFKKALEKTGKSIPSMSDDEKKVFFDKIDAAWDGKGEKNEELVGNQHKLDVDGDGEIEASDLAALRAKKDESVNEGKKVFKVNPGIGKAKYSISSHDGKKTHKDGSDFYDIEIFNNKVDLEKGIKKYTSNGFVKESVNEAKYPTDLRVGSVILGQGFTRLKGIEGGRYYKIVDMDDTTATLVPSDKNGNTKGSTKVRHKLDSIEGGIKTAKRGDENGIVVIKESVNEALWPKSKLPQSFQFALAPELKKNFKGIFYSIGDDIYHNDKKVLTVHGDNDSINSIIKKLKSKIKESVNEAMELPSATLPSAIKSKLMMAIDKIKDSKLTYNQKIQVIGQVMDSLGIDKGEFNKMSSKLKGTMESVNEATLINLKNNSDAQEIAAKTKLRYEDSWNAITSYLVATMGLPKALALVLKLEKEYSKLMRESINESINEGVSSSDMDKIKGAVEAANSFMSVGSELKKLGMKYTFATEPLPIYIIQPTPNNKVAIVNKKYASKPDFVVGDIAVGIMEGKSSKSVNEGRAFINAARKAKTEGLTEFEFNGKKYPVTIKD
jgi:hypothetical protein